MAQFRNGIDIINEILLVAGEVTNGNSPYQSRAVTYANRVHHAVICGGSILNVNVDEPWVWARSQFPMVIELQPAFTTGSCTFAYNSTNVQFSLAPSVSLEGWHLQANQYSTVYKIMNHTAGGTSAQLDSNFVDTSASVPFRAFKIDYKIFPAFLYVDNHNDRIDFQEINGTVATTLVASVQHGSYTPTNFIAQVVAQLNAIGTAAYSGSFDTVANTFAISASNCTANLLGASGANVMRSALPNLGLDTLDYTGSQSYGSTYYPNQVGRLIEPFKMFMTNWFGEHFCYSTDPIKMQEDYPIARIVQRFPDRFARIGEDNFGNIRVRFNTYPIQLTKFQIDWIPSPVDIQYNTASFVKLPRADVGVLIDGAAAMLLYDKNDDKWQTVLGRAERGLDAMKKKNHNLLFRTGEEFGQIVPRADLDRAVRKLDFGYTVNPGTAQPITAFTTPTVQSASLTFASFQTAATTSMVVASGLAQNMLLNNVIVQLTQSFTGSGITGCILNVGTLANPTQFINGFNVAQAVTSTAAYVAVPNYFPGISTNLYVELISTGANLSQLSQGGVNVFFSEQQT